MCTKRISKGSHQNKPKTFGEKHTSVTAARSVQTNLFRGSSESYLDNTDTLMQFSSENAGMPLQKQSFLQVNYRVKNIQLVNALESSKYSENTHIKKVCKSLSCCSYMAEIEAFGTESAHIFKTSAKCNRPFCPRCNSIQASKYKRRFVKAFQSEECESLFDGKYFYFMTLTLKHNKLVRTGIYLDELKKYIKELRRSKLWKHYFPYTKMNPQSGFVQSYETTIDENKGFHIHSHVMMCAPRLKGKIVEIEAKFRKKWNTLTGDSTGFDIQLVKLNKEETEKIKNGDNSSQLLRFISEIFKYTVKVGSINNIAPAKAEMFAEWIIETKGKNMITSNGFFRGLQLFTRKSKWDELTEEEQELSEQNLPHDPNFDYYIGPTSKLKFNHPKDKCFSKYQRKEKEHLLETVYLKELTTEFMPLGQIGEDFNKWLNRLISPSDKKFKSFLPYRIKAAQLAESERLYIEEMTSVYSSDTSDLTQEVIDEITRDFEKEWIQRETTESHNYKILEDDFLKNE